MQKGFSVQRWEEGWRSASGFHVVFVEKLIADVHPEMKINSVDWLVAGRYRSIKSNKAHCDPCRTKRRICGAYLLPGKKLLQECSSIWARGKKFFLLKFFSLKKLMRKIVELVPWCTSSSASSSTTCTDTCYQCTCSNVFKYQELLFCIVKNKPLSIKFRMHLLPLLPSILAFLKSRLNGNISVLNCCRFREYNSGWCDTLVWFTAVWSKNGKKSTVWIIKTNQESIMYLLKRLN